MEDIKNSPQALSSFIAAEMLLLAIVFVVERGIAAAFFKTYLSGIFFALMGIGLLTSRERAFELASSEKFFDIRAGMRGVIYATAWPNRLVAGEMTKFEAVSSAVMFLVFLACLWI